MFLSLLLLNELSGTVSLFWMHSELPPGYLEAHTKTKWWKLIADVVFNFFKDFLVFREREVIWRSLQKQREGMLKHWSGGLSN